MMAGIRGSGSRIERTLGAAMWRQGLRYRKQYRKLIGVPDFAFVTAKVAVFCDSSFWHGKDWARKRNEFKSNRAFWWPKIERNIARDALVTSELRKQGWIVMRFWDDEILASADGCARKVWKQVQRRLGRVE